MTLTIQNNMINRLWELIPISQITIRSYREMVPDRIIESLDAYEIAMKWEKMPNWKTHEDSIIAEESIIIPTIIPPSTIFFISGDCDFQHPISMPCADLSPFISLYFEKNRQSFYNGDVIIICGSYHYIYIFHHEGVYSNIFWQSQL